MHHSFIDKYSTLDSPVHQLDARIKLVSVLAYLIAVVLVSPGHCREFAIYGLLLGLVILLSRVPIKHFLQKSLIILPFMLLIAIFVPFRGEGPVLWHFPLIFDLKITLAGWQTFINIVVKAILAIWSMILLTSTTDFTSLLYALGQLKCPRMVIILLSFMYRYVFLIINEAGRLLIAREARRFRSNRRRDLKSLVSLVGMLFLRSYERAERVYLAMCAQGFDGKIHLLHKPRWQAYYSLILLFNISLILAIKLLALIYER